jgi:hypothetical protein
MVRGDIYLNNIGICLYIVDFSNNQKNETKQNTQIAIKLRGSAIDQINGSLVIQNSRIYCVNPAVLDSYLLNKATICATKKMTTDIP